MNPDLDINRWKIVKLRDGYRCSIEMGWMNSRHVRRLITSVDADRAEIIYLAGWLALASSHVHGHVPIFVGMAVLHERLYSSE